MPQENNVRKRIGRGRFHRDDTGESVGESVGESAGEATEGATQDAANDDSPTDQLIAILEEDIINISTLISVVETQIRTIESLLDIYGNFLMTEDCFPYRQYLTRA